MEMKKYKLGDVADINKQTISKKDSMDIIEYLDTGSLTENIFGPKQVLSREDAPSRAQRRVFDKTILYSTVRPRLKHYGFLESPKENTIVSTGFATIDVKDEFKNVIDARYLYLLLIQDKVTEYLGTIADTAVSAYPSLNPSDIQSLEFEFPDISIQKKVASTLSSLDKRIENLRAQNRVLEQTAKTTYDYTFLQCAGHQTTYNKTLNRNIPADWEVKRLGDLVSVSKESLNPQNYPKKQFKHFSIPSFDDNGSYSLEYGKDIFSNKFIVNNNHVLISKLNPWKNRAVWCDENDDAIGSTEFVTLLPHKLEDKAFIFSVVKSDSFIEYCSDAATGTSHSHRRVSPDIMMKFPIAYDEKTVIKFNAQVTPLFKKQLVNTKQIETLTTQRNTLLPLLMTGQVTIA